MTIKHGIPEVFRGPKSEGITTAKEFLVEIEKCFAKNDKAETSTLLTSLISMKYKGKRNIREYIMEMSHIASKLNTLKLELSDDFLEDRLKQEKTESAHFASTSKDKGKKRKKDHEVAKSPAQKK
ncbi:hypothetical protein ACOSP7_013311 [Xanthoceras sorbifolium]